MSSLNHFIRPLSVVVLLFYLHGTQGAKEADLFKVLDQDILDIRYDGKWGQICVNGNYFDANIQDAICRQMGMTNDASSDSFGSKSVPLSQIRIYKVRCTGTTLDSCSFTPANSSSKCPEVSPTKSSSITLECKPITDVHLISTGSDPHSGQVEIVRGAERGVVCYDSTKSGNVANVTCKQMGYSGVTATDNISKNAINYTGKSFDVTCASGSAANLDGCTISEAGSACNSILHVQCTLTNASQITFDVRLSQSSKPIAGATSGTVEVFQYGKWGVICDTGWSISAANVVCRQLGFNGAVPTTGFPTKAKFGQGTGTVFWNNVQCSGDEPSIAECDQNEVFGIGACDSVNASGVICSTKKLPQIDICDIDSTRNITGGVTFIQSTGYPTYNFVYNGSTVCKVELMSPTDFTVYIQQKMFQSNHNEYLLFETKEGRVETLYGDNSTQGPIIFNTKKLTIAFRANGAAGTGKINIMVTVPELPSTSTSTEKPGSTASLGNKSQIIDGPTPKPVNPAVIIGAVLGSVSFFIFVIIGVICRKKVQKIPENIIRCVRRNSSVRSHDVSQNGTENKGFKKSDDDQSAALGFKGTGGTDVITETGFNTDEPKEPETGERKQNGRIGRPASGSEVKVDIDKPAFNAYELEEQPPSIGNPYEFEGPAKDSVKPWVVESSATADNANSQYAVVNKVRRGRKGPAFVIPNETPNPRAKPPPYVYANNLKQDIDNGNINDDSVQPADEYEEVRKPQTFVPGQSAAYADIELGAGGAPSIQEQGPPVPENKTKKDKKKKENEKDKEGDKKEAKKGEKKRGKKGDNKENKTEDKEADQKEDKKKSKGKKGDKSDGKKNVGSSDDISGLRPVGDSCAVPMSGDFSTYAEVSKETSRIGPAGGSQQDESGNAYDVFIRKGPNYRPGPSDPTYGVLNFQA